MPHDVKLGRAFCALLERLDPRRLPMHGGDATTVVVTVDLRTLADGLGTAALGSDGSISAGEARRLACTAKIVPPLQPLPAHRHGRARPHLSCAGV